MNKAKITTVLAVLIMVALPVSFLISDGSNADPNGYLLIDDGNGTTEWKETTADGSKTIGQLVKGALEDKGRTYEYSAGIVTVDGKSTTVMGGDDTTGTFVTSGTTGVKVTSTWKLFRWDATVWTPIAITELDSVYASGSYALGFYPAGTGPVETPDHRTSWTMIRGNSQQDGHQESVFTTEDKATFKWEKPSNSNGVYGSVLYANDLVFAKFGIGSGMGTSQEDTKLVCYNMDGVTQWEFSFPGILYYENMTPVIVGDYIYTTTGLGFIFKLPWKTGPGTGEANVTMFNGNTGAIPYDRATVEAKTGAIPYQTGAEVKGQPFSTGPSSLVYDSGTIFTRASNGMIYCFDLDLNLIWSSQMGGYTYYISPTIYGDYVFTGAHDGALYVMDKKDGHIIDKKVVFTTMNKGKEYGCVNAPVIFKNESLLTVAMGFTEGRGMSSANGGVALYSFNGFALTEIYKTSTTSGDKDYVGVVSNYVLPVETDTFRGIMYCAYNGMYSTTLDGQTTHVNDTIAEVHGPPLLVNNERIYLASYTASKPIYILNTKGEITNLMENTSQVRNYNMTGPTVIGDYVFVGNDSGMYCVYGQFDKYIPPTENQTPWWMGLVIALAIILALVVVLWIVLKFVFKKDKPFTYIAERIKYYLGSDELTHNTRSKHRLLIVIIVGIVGSIVMFLVCLMSGSTSTLSLSETLSALFSAIGKGGNNLTYEEVVVYSSRLPRALAAFAVGVGLSVAGCMYQAIIRNPMVDPYIMGVSSGAGTAAIAVIAFDFTLFGLLPSHSVFLTAIVAMIGGLLAFMITMLLAEKAGGSSINYVLAGIVVGLAFSAVQTLMMSMAGNHVTNALTWLFGSFSNISWTQIWVVFIPALFLSSISLIWAKEFNLVLLGEDQAKQMGLNVRKFNRWMLIIASILTAVCVAFCGIIGFVGLVVPHLCRMILGGDHRLVLPSSMALGGFLMMLADYASRMIMPGQELPVGAITTIIGVPVFAWLLIRRGKMYEG